jgi:hypothetical protein
MIMTAWPMSGTWIIGLLIAIDMIFHGWGYVALALVAKDANNLNILICHYRYQLGKKRVFARLTPAR